MRTPREIVRDEVLVCASSLISQLSEALANTTMAEELWDMFETPNHESALEEVEGEGYELVEYEPGTWAFFAEGDAWNEENALCEGDDREEVIEEGVDELCGSHISEYRYEVYEHWIVTDWLGKKLEDQGEKVVDFYNLNIFCRCCSGQAIAMDPYIIEIAKESGWVPKHDCDFG